MGVLAGFLIICILIIGSALVSGSEIAFFSFNRENINKLHSHTRSKIKKLLERPKQLLATILIANNFINIAIVIVATYVTNELLDLTAYPLLAFILQAIVFTSVILIFGEILPKTYANAYPVNFASYMATPLSMMVQFFKPFSKLLIKTSILFDKHIEKKGLNITLSDLSAALDITSSKENEEENKILKRIVSFKDIEVSEIMRPRLDVIGVDKKASLHELLEIINENSYSRMPVFTENIDHVIGVLHIKELIPELNNPITSDWHTFIRPAMFVPENKMINELLQEFRENKIHLAIVVDEYGGTSGIITLEDVIEEILGEINDEFDQEEALYTKIDTNTFVFDGKIQLHDMFKVVNLDDSILDETSGDPETLAGLILELVGEIPKANKSLTFKNLDLRIESSDPRRIRRVKVTIKPNAE